MSGPAPWAPSSLLGFGADDPAVGVLDKLGTGGLGIDDHAFLLSGVLPSSSPLKGTMTDGIWADAAEQLWIGADGKRFVNEYAERDVLAKASMAMYSRSM